MKESTRFIRLQFARVKLFARPRRHCGCVIPTATVPTARVTLILIKHFERPELSVLSSDRALRREPLSGESCYA